MQRIVRFSVSLLLFIPLALQAKDSFQIEEATIDQMQAAIRSGQTNGGADREADP